VNSWTLKQTKAKQLKLSNHLDGLFTHLGSYVLKYCKPNTSTMMSRLITCGLKWLVLTLHAMLSSMQNDHIGESKTCKTAKQMWEAQQILDDYSCYVTQPTVYVQHLQNEGTTKHEAALAGDIKLDMWAKGCWVAPDWWAAGPESRHNSLTF